jgi:hypothetical protein
MARGWLHYLFRSADDGYAQRDVYPKDRGDQSLRQRGSVQISVSASGDLLTRGSRRFPAAATCWEAYAASRAFPFSRWPTMRPEN